MKKKSAESTEDESTPLNKKRTIVRTVITSKRNGDSKKKWLLLALCCSIMASMYYILAMPAALHRQLFAIMPTSENFEMNFNLLFTVSYVPNMILPLFGGAIVDKYGQAKCIVAFSIVVFLGQAVTAMGVSRTSWSAMLAGRLIFGLGAQNLIVANASLVSKWFAGNEGVALGLSNVCSYAGVIATNMLSPKLSNSINPPFAFWLGVAAEGVAIALGFVVIFMDRNKPSSRLDTTNSLVCSPMFSPVAIRHSSLVMTSDTVLQASAPSPGVTFGRKKEVQSDASSSVLGKIRTFKPTFWLLCCSFLLVYGVVWSFTNVSSAILLERDFFIQPPTDCVLQYPDQCSSGSLATEANPALDSKGAVCPASDNYAPPIPHALNVTLDDGTEYSFHPLRNSDVQCQDDFWAEACVMNYCEHQAEATEKAGFYMSIPYFFTVALTFHLGLLVDSTGYRTEMICCGSALLVAAHMLLAYPITSPPVVPLVAQGLGYTICVAALWPSVPFTVSEDSVGTAFGLMMAVQNIGLALIPLIVAHLYSLGNNHYLPTVELFFAACSLLAVLIGVALMVADKRTDKILGTPKPSIRFNEEEGAFVMIRERANSHPILFGPTGRVV